jgi:hypothetical protein
MQQLTEQSARMQRAEQQLTIGEFKFHTYMCSNFWQMAKCDTNLKIPTKFHQNCVVVHLQLRHSAKYPGSIAGNNYKATSILTRWV